ncbi:MAG: nucleotide exchange factor GrpE [Kiritimatiellia bacterium]
MMRKKVQADQPLSAKKSGKIDTSQEQLAPEPVAATDVTGESTVLQQDKAPAPADGPMARLLAEDKETLAERVLRVQAEFDNFRKRTLREKEESARRANEQLISELLPVVDHLELALEVGVGREEDALAQGLRLIHSQFLAVLRKFGVVPMETAGRAFDPNLHEAVSRMPAKDVQEGMILQEVRRGYLLGDRLLRSAQVVVSSGIPAGVASGSETGTEEPERNASEGR